MKSSLPSPHRNFGTSSGLNYRKAALAVEQQEEGIYVTIGTSAEVVIIAPAVVVRGMVTVRRLVRETDGGYNRGTGSNPTDIWTTVVSPTNV